MRLLLDTNIVLDYFGVNKGFEEDAETIFNLAVTNKVIELVSASAITDIYYIANNRLKDREQVMSIIKAFREYVKAIPVTDEDIEKAIELNWKDFEDAVQYCAAKSNGINYIITRNSKDFELHDIPCMNPTEFLSMFAEDLK